MELDVGILFELSRLKVMTENISRYPAAERDIAIVVREGLPAREVEAVIRQRGGQLLRAVSVFDVYAGEQVAAGSKSLAFKMTFQSADRTLTEAEVNNLMEEIRSALAAELQATSR